jgi:hypothetical protein
MIWEYSLPDPRLIHILGSSTSFEFGTGGTVRCTYRIPTTLLHTSREARDIALRYYKFVFSSSLQGGDKPVWVDYERDTICFGDYKLLADFFGLVGQYTEVDHDLTSSSLDCLESIRHVAVGGLVTVHEVDLLGELAALESLTLLEMDEYRRTRECFSWRRFGKKFEKAMYEEWEQRGRRAQLPELFFLEKTEFEKRFEVGAYFPARLLRSHLLIYFSPGLRRRFTNLLLRFWEVVRLLTM